MSTVRAYLAREAKLPEPHALPEEIYRACHTLSGSSKMAQARHGIRLAEPLDHWLRRAFGSGPGLTDEDLACSRTACRRWSRSPPIWMSPPATSSTTGSCSSASSAPTRPSSSASPRPPRRPKRRPPRPQAGEGPDEPVDFDPEVAAIFTDEATELIEASERALADWRAQPNSQDLRLGLKRPLHTLKGGARMAGIMPMGDLSHELENLVMLVDNGTVTADPPLFDAIQASLDELARMREQVVNGRPRAPGPRDHRAPANLLASGCGGSAARARAAGGAAAAAATATPSKAPAPTPAFTLTDDTGSQTMLAKFNAELLLAGEEAAEPAARTAGRAAPTRSPHP